MSDNPAPESPPRRPCSIIIPTVTRTPIFQQEYSIRSNFLSPFDQFTNGAYNQDLVNNFTRSSSLPLSPIPQNSSTYRPGVVDSANSMIRPSPVPREPHMFLDRTPIVHTTRSIGEHQYQRGVFTRLSFSPVNRMTTVRAQPEEDNGNEMNASRTELKFDEEPRRQNPLLYNLQQYQDNFEEQQVEQGEQEREISIDGNQRQTKPIKIKKTRCKKNGSKGLKTLSHSVYNISKAFKKVSYKEIAALVIADFIRHGKIQAQNNQKEIQNAKRRVYDALNVLVAAEVLVRAGKHVHEAPPKSKTAIEKIQEERKEKLLKAIEEKREEIKELKERVMMSKDVLSSVVRLQRRNKVNPAPEEQRIEFPLFMFYQEKGREINVGKTRGKVRVSMEGFEGMMGDALAVTNLELPYPKMHLSKLSKKHRQLIKKIESERDRKQEQKGEGGEVQVKEEYMESEPEEELEEGEEENDEEWKESEEELEEELQQIPENLEIQQPKNQVKQEKPVVKIEES